MIKYLPFELHTHTIHSDGGMTPETLVNKAVERGLVGFAMTDHNTSSAVPEVVKLGNEKGLIIIPGIEWTTFFGHITVLGGKCRVNWRELTRENINEKIALAVAGGDIVNVAHPKRFGSPICTGCYADYKITDYTKIAGWEVWSNPKPQFNVMNSNSDAEYLSLLNMGCKIACIHGDDWHDEKNNKKAYAMTWLGIEGEPSAASAVEAIRRNRTYISTGVEMNVKLTGKGGFYGLGDTVKADKYTLECLTKLIQPYADMHQVNITGLTVREGGTGKVRSYPITPGRDLKAELELKKGFIRFELTGSLEGEDGTMLITSPIYVKEK